MATNTGWQHTSGVLLFFLLLTGVSVGTALAAGSNQGTSAKARSKARAQTGIHLPGYPSAWKGERTLPEIKVELMRRAKLGMYPATGISPADMQAALASIHALGKNEWGPAFIAVGDRYMAKANALVKSDPAAADSNYLKAWQLYSFGRWPVPWSAGRKLAYRKALEAYHDHAKFMDPPMKIVRIPYAGSEIVAYLRLPKNRKGPVPVLLAISGLDSRKENTMQMFSALLPYGIGVMTVDGPGTGQAPVKFSPTADKMFSRVIDYLYAQPEVDKTRIGVYGASLGAYWATKLAFTERARLKCVVPQSPGADFFFGKKWTVGSQLGNREYVYGTVAGLMYVTGVETTLSQFLTAWAKNSLATQGLLGKPTAPMFIIAGAKDTQVPFTDTELLLRSGPTPKYAWVNPQGGHMGRELHVWPDVKIFHEITLPWLVRALQPEEAAKGR